jgi:hypothetical protein
MEMRRKRGDCFGSLESGLAMTDWLEGDDDEQKERFMWWVFLWGFPALQMMNGERLYIPIWFKTGLISYRRKMKRSFERLRMTTDEIQLKRSIRCGRDNKLRMICSSLKVLIAIPTPFRRQITGVGLIVT